jgi:hypothetical protein
MLTKTNSSLLLSLVLVLLLSLLAGSGLAQEPAPITPQEAAAPAFEVTLPITYQGSLQQGGQPANGQFDFYFLLYNAPFGGTLKRVVVLENLPVSKGLFTATLDIFGGGAFTNQPVWLEIQVRPGAETGSFTTLTPRQALTAAPYAWALPYFYTRYAPGGPNIFGGHPLNSISAGVSGAVISGGGSQAEGYFNEVTDNFGTVGGGLGNRAGNSTSFPDDAILATVGGGRNNTASGEGSTIGGGGFSTASGVYATIAGGYGNMSSGYLGTVGGGSSNSSSGQYATVPGGSLNTAAGAYSFAAGRRAAAAHEGAFVWGGSVDAAVSSPAANTFSVRAPGGIWLGTTNSPSIPAGRFLNTSTGAYLTTGGVWTNSSDRAGKINFTQVDSLSVLERVAALPITSWSYRAEDASVRHIGPLAQDFYAAFGLGQGETSIATVDADGVALASIQGLYRLTQEKDARILELEAALAAQQTQIDLLRAASPPTTAAAAAPAGPGTLIALAALLLAALACLLAGAGFLYLRKLADRRLL